MDVVFSQIVGRHPSMREAFEMVRMGAPVRASVLITGESGTGKELVARGIHLGSGRRDGPFVPVNCGAIPAELMPGKPYHHRMIFRVSTTD